MKLLFCLVLCLPLAACQTSKGEDNHDGDGTVASTGEPSSQTEQPSSMPATSSASSPKIVAFYATPQTVFAGDTTTLAWVVENADRVELDGVAVTGTQLSRVVDASTVFTLTAFGASGSDTATATVTVGEPVLAPVIVDFNASETAIQVGNSTTLTWTVEHASTVTLDGDPVGPTGSLSVAPTSTRSYTLNATGPGGTVSLSLNLLVTAGPPPPAPTGIVFNAPASILRGASGTLSWSGSNVTRFLVTTGATTLSDTGAAGSLSVSPTVTTNYTLQASGDGGTVTRSKTITVHQPPAIGTFTATPASISSGGSTTLAWTGLSAASAKIGSTTITGATGSLVVSPTTTTTYTLTATGTGGNTTSKTATVTVTAPVSTKNFYVGAYGSGIANWSYNATTPETADAVLTKYFNVTIGATWGGLSLVQLNGSNQALAFDHTAYAALNFYLTGTQGAQIYVALEDTAGNAGPTKTVTANALGTNGAWTLVQIPMAQLVGAGNSGYYRVTFGADPGTQFKVAHVTLGSPVTVSWPSPPANGCSAISGTMGATETAQVWFDDQCKQRSAVLVNQAGTTAPGYMRQLIYKVGSTDRVCNGTGANGWDGVGFIWNHHPNGDNGGRSYGGVTSFALNGAHHRIVQMATASRTINGRPVAQTIHYMFATGRPHPLWAITYNATAATGITADSRGPYGDMHYDGTIGGAYAGNPVGGIAWGTTHKFISVTPGTTNESTTLTSNSGWTYNTANTIPFAMEWTSAVDAEQGFVQTTTIDEQTAGEGGSLAPGGSNTAGGFLTDEQYAYQITNYVGLDAGGTVVKRLCWGTPYGFVGGDGSAAPKKPNEFDPFSGSVRRSGSWQSYSVFMVFGTHTGGVQNGTTGKLVKQMENNQLADLSATVGTVLPTGPAGVNRPQTMTYSPPGYNSVYATWDVRAASNVVTATLTPQDAAHALDHPILVVQGYTATTLPTVTINGAAAANGDQVFMTLDDAGDRVWITLNRSVSSATQIHVAP